MEYRDNDSNFSALKALKNNIVPFVGAGMSAFAYKGWSSFLKSCCETEEQISYVDELLTEYKFEEAASYLKQELNLVNENTFEKAILKEFDENKITFGNLNHETISLLPTIFCGPVITTNFDRVIEKVYELCDVLIERVLLQNSQSVDGAIRANKPFLFKIHGDINDICNIILTKEQYDSSYLETPSFIDNFRMFLQAKPLLFLGCSLQNDRTMDLMKKVIGSAIGAFNYAFIESHEFDKNGNIILDHEEEVHKIEERLLSINIKPIWFPEGEFKCINTLLTQFNVQEDIDYNKIFKDSFTKPLFLESVFPSATQATLKDLFVDPKYIIHHSDPKILCDDIFLTITQFVKDELPKEKKVFLPDTTNTVDALFIVGYPGAGKSSLVSKISHEHTNLFENTLYCFKLRSLKKSQANIEAPLIGILGALRLEKKDLYNAVLVLDGLDEMCGVLNLGDDIDKYCNNLIRNVKRNCKNCKIIFTTRDHYVNYKNDDYKLCIFLDLIPFDKIKACAMFDNYRNIHTGIPQQIRDNIEKLFSSSEENDIKKTELFGIPLALYIIFSLKKDISRNEHIGELFDSLFGELKNRYYTVKAEYEQKSGISIVEKTPVSEPHGIEAYKTCDEIAMAIAIKMFETKKDMLSNELYQEVLKEINGIEPVKDKELVISERYFLLSFYYRELNDENRSVEFVHKSIMEYFIGQHIYIELASQLDSPKDEQIEKLWLCIDRVFMNASITSGIADFVLYHSQKNSNAEAIFDMLNVYFDDYMERGMFFKTEEVNNKNAIERIIRSFNSYWSMLKTLAVGKTIMKSSIRSTLLSNIIFRVFLGTIDLEGEDLSGVDFSWCNLRFANMKGAKFHLANLNFADLIQTYFHNADLSGANLSLANLCVSDLSYANLSGSNLTGANLFCADLTGADLTNVELGSVNLASANFTGANLAGLNLSFIDLTSTVFHCTDLKGINLTKAKLWMSDLSEANLHKTNFNTADLFRANLQDADLTEADLYMADLSEADLSKTNLRGADLSGANFHKCIFYQTNLFNSKISKVLSVGDSTETKTRKTNGYKKKKLKAKGNFIYIRWLISNHPKTINMLRPIFFGLGCFSVIYFIHLIELIVNYFNK